MCRLKEIIKNICLSVLLMGLGLPVVNAATISFSPSASNVSTGSTFSVDIMGASFPIGFDGGSLNVSFNSSIIQVNSVSVDGGYWNFIADSGITDNTSGNISGIEFGRWGMGTDFTIATLNITALASGISPLGLELNGSANFPTFSADNASYGGLILNNGSVTVTGASPVPVPAALWLFGSGLVGLFVVSKKKK